MPDTNYKHLEYFVMLGTHSEPRRGEMSHICDISPLRVNFCSSGNVIINVSPSVTGISLETPTQSS